MLHGAWSPRKVDPLAAQYVDLLVSDPANAYLAAPAYAPAVWRWATLEARLQLLDEWISNMTIEQQTAPTRRGGSSPLDLWRQFEATAQTARSRLGLDPLSRARLGRDVAQTRLDLAQLLSADKQGDDDDEE
ncbi:hypothetical protein [Microbacterium capsulatum]|uniref:Uncharacterized protein n=1 Tax=Microbacterium capsulatum TaxID=3041921 RepID=A0ABU0XF82_9MICO|nr:hypothetical protein [Microbacterium sp. ASV81]MDQ4213774.1 hypothetical protein [Microbacterium sp. ASV81]